MESYGLGTLFRKENPYEKRVKTAAAVADKSGFAKPLIYAAMGADMSNAEQWDSEQAVAQNQQAEAKAAQTMLQTIIKISETQPEAANDLLQDAAARNPHLAPYGKIKFIDKSTKEWVMVTDASRQPFAVSKAGLAWITQQNKDKVYGDDGKILPDVAQKVFIPFGAKKSDQFKLTEQAAGDAVLADYPYSSDKDVAGIAAQHNPEFGGKVEKAKALARGGMGMKDIMANIEKTEADPKSDFNLFYKAMKAKGLPEDEISAAWEERKVRVARESRPPRDASEPPTTNMKEHAIYNADRKKAGKPELSFEEYMKIKFEWNDPYGVKETIKNRLNQGKPQGTSTITPQRGTGAKPIVRYNPVTGRFE